MDVKDRLVLGGLKVVGNEKEGGVKKVANDRNWPQTAAIEVCLPYNLLSSLHVKII